MTLAERLRAIIDALPDGASVTLPVAEIRLWLNDVPSEAPTPLALVSSPLTWKERIWTCPEDVRLGVHEVAEAVDRSPDWVYRATSSKYATLRGRDPLPCAKLDGVLVFTAGAVRRWLERSARIVHPEPPRLRSLRKPAA